MFRLQNLPKSVMFLTHIRAFPPPAKWVLFAVRGAIFVHVFRDESGHFRCTRSKFRLDAPGGGGGLPYERGGMLLGNFELNPKGDQSGCAPTFF